MNATTVAVDLAKSVFQLAVADAPWRVIETQRLTRTQFERWLNRDVTLVIMEACGSAHHWARWLNGLGIEVRLLPAQYVRAYVKRNKTDAADAAALLEAARASDMRPVRIKSVEQQALQGLHRIRSLWMGTRTSRINALRGFLREFGIAIPVGARTGIEAISRVLVDPGHGRARPDPGHRQAAARRDPSARSAYCPARARTGLAGQAESGVHHAAVDPRHWLADRHSHGGRHLRGCEPFQGCAALRQLVWADAQGVQLGQFSLPGAHLQEGRPLPAHAAHAWRQERAARGQGGRQGRARGVVCATGRSRYRPGATTTRRRVRWPTSWRASATPRSGTSSRMASQPCGPDKKINRESFDAGLIRPPTNSRHQEEAPHPSRVATRLIDHHGQTGSPHTDRRR